MSIANFLAHTMLSYRLDGVLGSKVLCIIYIEMKRQIIVFYDFGKWGCIDGKVDVTESLSTDPWGTTKHVILEENLTVLCERG